MRCLFRADCANAGRTGGRIHGRLQDRLPAGAYGDLARTIAVPFATP